MRFEPFIFSVITQMENDRLKKIPDGKPVRIFLPVKESKERYRASCIYQKEESPHFSLNFKLGELPREYIDLQQTCIINIDLGGQSVSLEALIKEISGPQTLKMVAQKTIDHKQLRDFFRVDATTQVISKAFQPKISNQKGEDFSFNGTTIDISGSGILASFSELPPMDKKVKLEITLPNDSDRVITAIARPIRSQQISADQYVVAYHFEEIETEDRDLIIGSCLIIQRQLLRMKVQVNN